jgi:hypothetical protein
MAEVTIPLKLDPSFVGNIEKSDFQFALRTSAGQVYALDRIPAQVATIPEGQIDQGQFRQCFQTYGPTFQTVVEDATIAEEKDLNAVNVFVVGRNGPKTYVSFALATPGNLFVGELEQVAQTVQVNVKGPSNQLFGIIEGSARALFTK